MNSNIVTLYHGTTHDFSAIDSSLGNPYKDFGRGFYTSRTESQAINLAIRNREIANGRLSISSTNEKVAAWLYVYEFDMQFLNFLNFKEFKKPDLQWVDFIVSNRSNPKFRHGYDMVIGPAANDDTQVTLAALLNRVYGDPQSVRSREIFLEFILAESLPYQTFFATAKACSLLVLKERRVLP